VSSVSPLNGLTAYRPTSVFLFVALSVILHAAFAVYAYKTGFFSADEVPSAPAKTISVSLIEPTPVPIKPPPPVQPPKPKKVKKRIVTKAASERRIAVKPKKIKKIEKSEPVVIKPVAAASPLPTPVAKTPVFVSPRPSYQPKPKYPTIARRRGQEGIVILEISVSNSGNVNRASVVESSGSSALDRAALKTIKTWKFPASQFNSLSSFKQKIQFRLNAY